MTARMKAVGVVVTCLLSGRTPALAQHGGFVVTLGHDTVQVERFSREGQAITGILATRTPSVRLLRYEARVDATGRLLRYEQRSANPDGAPLLPDPVAATMTFTGDTVERVTFVRGERVTHRIHAPDGAWPFGTIPLHTPFIALELALAAARNTPLTASPALHRLAPSAVQSQPSRTPLLFARPDSVEVDYFGQGRFGVVFDAAGRLLRSDWRGTTYKVLVSRVDHADPEGAARGWAALESSGKRFGRLSPRDSTIVEFEGARIVLDYSRPAARGRRIWGAVVPWNVVWRLGADVATHLGTDKPLMVGDVALPAGTYTLWMLPSETAPMLIINRQTRIFGTQYNASHDLARVPLTATVPAKATERLTLDVVDRRLRITWSDREFSVALRTPP